MRKLDQVRFLAEQIKRFPERDLARLQRDLPIFQLLLRILQNEREIGLLGEVGHCVAHRSVLEGQTNTSGSQSSHAVSAFFDLLNQLLRPALDFPVVAPGRLAERVEGWLADCCQLPGSLLTFLEIGAPQLRH